MNLDQYDDTNNEYMKKLANAGIVIDKKENINKLPDKDFALIIMKKRKHRKFPICDKDNTILSILYFLKNMNELPESFNKVTGAKLKEACLKYDIDIPSKLESFDINVESNVVKEADMKKNAAKLTKQQRESLPDSQFGLIIEKNGKKIRKFPMPDKTHVMKAIQFYPKVKNNLTPDQKETLKKNIVREAKKHGIDTDIDKKASVNPYLMRDMEFRTRHLPGKAKKPYIKLAEKVENKEIKIKEASVLLKRLDKENNFDTRKMPPEEVLTDKKKHNSIDKYASIEEFFNPLIKEAESENYPRVITQILDDDDRAGSLLEKLEENFDESLVQDLKHDPETIFESLPEPHQEIIKNIIDEVRL